VKTPNAALSGINKIYAGQHTTLSVNFSGIPPFGFSYYDHAGVLKSVTGINTNKYEFVVSPTVNYTYSLLSASDKNNASIAVSGTPLVTVIASPKPLLTSGADDWSIISGDEFGKPELDTKKWNIAMGAPIVQNDELRLPINKLEQAMLLRRLK